MNSKLIITGDLNQSDFKMQNGLQHFVHKMETVNTFDDIKMVEFNRENNREIIPIKTSKR